MSVNREQLSLLITFFSMAIVVLVLYNVHLGKQSKEDTYVVEMLLDEEVLDEILKKEEEKLEKPANDDPLKSHMAFNQASRSKYDDPEPLKTLEELMEEVKANSSEMLSDSEYAVKAKELAEKQKEREQLLHQKDAQKKAFTNNLAARRTSVSYSLIERNHIQLPPPIYTCIEGGKVVVNIEVSAQGDVLEADFNSKSSTTSNGCLIENAIKYALKAKFNSTAKEIQKGTITYLFQKKDG